jgi:simple sugar transport system permease protein
VNTARTDTARADTEPTTTTGRGAAADRLRRVASHRLFWPAVILVGLMLVNLPSTPDYFSIGVRHGHLYGSLINILIFTAPQILVGVGLTLVIATSGIDLWARSSPSPAPRPAGGWCTPRTRTPPGPR